MRYNKDDDMQACYDYFVKHFGVDEANRKIKLLNTLSEEDILKLRNEAILNKVKKDKIIGESSWAKEEDAIVSLKKIKTQPSDLVQLSSYEDEVLCTLWEKNMGAHNIQVPADLFFSGTIPIIDVEIEIDESDKEYSFGSGVKVKARIAIYPDYVQIIDDDPGFCSEVGVVILQLPFGEIYVPICLLVGYDYLTWGRPYAFNNRIKSCDPKDICNSAYQFMCTWYGIQISLLNPKIKHVFLNNEHQRLVYDHEAKTNKRKRVTRYIKVHKINQNEFDEAVYGSSDNKKHFRCLVWYVMGHWRKYKNGKQVFIQGYWKGELRNLKQNIDDGRNRLVEIGGVT